MNSRTTLIIRPLKQKFTLEVPLPGPPPKKTITQTEPVQKIHPQNVDQLSQELPIPQIASSWGEEVEIGEAVAREGAASGEVQPVSRASVSEESEETTSDRGSQSAPEQPLKKKPKFLQPNSEPNSSENGENSFDKEMLRKYQEEMLDEELSIS